MIDKLLNFLEDFTLEERKQQLWDIANQRTRYTTVVLENIYQTQNASAVLRSCDCFGIQDVHIIENENTFNVNPQVVMGATKWLNLHRYNERPNNTLTALKKLKGDGYRIVATSPHENDVNLNDLDLSKGKIAFVFGNEREGISDIVKEEADEFMKIPMYGFSESLNISVCAAITLQHVTTELKQSNINWHLPDDELKRLYFEWLKKSIKKSDLLVDEFNQRNNTDF
ncbi:RNA methyltransferase [Carboxylicivirga sediminis]|uniref:tRNA (guanosine(18)-2'-O)-methyltransferase n=1 Tax=Carboxylicivirga sediminis TaxID=2006564 RepID=A0A941IWU2_9BACT|nr:RNA methyltransferase [Carboxylicivirga sediminis]MBR8536071.1 RNA methyltransferase [Carboxylicivirga sediminis]